MFFKEGEYTLRGKNTVDQEKIETLSLMCSLGV